MYLPFHLKTLFPGIHPTQRSVRSVQGYTYKSVHCCCIVKVTLLVSILKEWLNNLCRVSKVAFPVAAKEALNPYGLPSKDGHCILRNERSKFQNKKNMSLFLIKSSNIKTIWMYMYTCMYTCLQVYVQKKKKVLEGSTLKLLTVIARYWLSELIGGRDAIFYFSFYKLLSYSNYFLKRTSITLKNYKWKYQKREVLNLFQPDSWPAEQ